MVSLTRKLYVIQIIYAVWKLGQPQFIYIQKPKEIQFVPDLLVWLGMMIWKGTI